MDLEEGIKGFSKDALEEAIKQAKENMKLSNNMLLLARRELKRRRKEDKGGNEVLPLYLKQEPREPLSDEELSILATDDLYDCTYTTTVFAYKEYAKKIEKAHGIGE